MKKIFSVLVVAMLCVCMLVPTVSALSDIELDDIAGSVDAEGIAEMEAALDKYLAGSSSSDTAEDTTATTASSASSVATLLDLSWLTEVLSTDTSAFTEMFNGFDASNLDSLLAVISETMSGAGIDLASFDLSALGTFDITSVLSSTAALSGGETQDLAATVTNMTAGLADTLKSGLTALGLDTATVEGLLDNEIVNFFANMYIGFIGEVEETTTEETTTEKKETTTKKPAVVTTKPPKTGDTSAVVVAIATLTLASGAALVCLKKKED